MDRRSPCMDRSSDTGEDRGATHVRSSFLQETDHVPDL